MGTRWMPRQQEAMKDVVSCEKFRGAATSFDPKMSEWGNPAGSTCQPAKNTYLLGSELEELKHLSTRRKRKQ